MATKRLHTFLDRRRRERLRVASGLERALTDDGRRGVSAAVPVDRRAVDQARPYLAQLADALRSPRPVAPDGVARARRLLTDVHSPLYASGEPAQLRDAAGRALRELDPAPPSAECQPQSSR
jgi:hypothetical protein